MTAIYDGYRGAAGAIALRSSRQITPNPRAANPRSGEPEQFGASPAVIRRRRFSER
jgi:hypothetical protein